MSSERIYEAFGRALATRRRQLGLTQHKLAARVGVSRASIANIERGRQNVALHHLYNLAFALETERVSDLLPPTKSVKKREREAMTLSGFSVTSKERAQVSELVRSVLAQGARKRRKT